MEKVTGLGSSSGHTIFEAGDLPYFWGLWMVGWVI